MRIAGLNLLGRIAGISAFVGCGLVFSSVVNAQTASKTVSDAEARWEQAWQKASAKYDRQRAKLLQDVDSGVQSGPFQPEWDSLAKYEVPQWFRDAKFGVFLHWGLYSVPAFANEWYPRNMYKAGTEENKHQVATYGPLTQFGYKDFLPMFKAEHFDAKAWVALFKESGIRYVVPVFEHHDGLAMYDSGLSDWTAVKMGPHRDVLGELAAEVRAQGLVLGASSHRIEHDFFMEGGHQLDSDVSDAKYAAFYGPAHTSVEDKMRPGVNPRAPLSSAYASDWLARDAEIVEKYHPDLMYFDWWIGNGELEPYLKRFAAFYYNDARKHGQASVINYKSDAMREHTAVLDVERGQLGAIRPEPWQTDTSISNKSWGYIEGDSFKTPGVIVRQLVDIVSKNGNLLLNVGPRSDGTIPDEAQQTLREVGAWLRVNGEAIYGTRPWKHFGEGPTKVIEGQFHDTDTSAYTSDDYRFTTKGDTLFAIELGWPSGKEAVIRSLASDAASVKSVSQLGSNGELHFRQTADGLHIEVPEKPPCKYAYTFRIGFSKDHTTSGAIPSETETLGVGR